MHKQLAKLFAGDDSKFIKATLTGVVTERGKKEAKYTTLHEPVTEDIWKGHLEGEYKIGILPEKGEVAKWGCIDVDPKNYTAYSTKKYIDLIKTTNLPLVPVLSKSGGLHLFLFLKDWTSVKEIRSVLDKWNDKYFMSDEVFPMNKAVGMPYSNANAAAEYAFNEDGRGMLCASFIQLAQEKITTIEELKSFKENSYEPEAQWSQYPPCVQKLINEKWHGDNRNNLLFNVLVLETKKNEAISVEDLVNIARKRNTEIFSRPLDDKEVISLAKSIKKGGYFYKCPPKHQELQSICNKELCKMRMLGVQPETPSIIDKFVNITFVKDLKTMYYEFDYDGHHIVVTPEDMKDEKCWRVKFLKYGIYWMTLPKPKRGPAPFELLLKEITVRAKENKNMQFEETLEDARYKGLKDFFEDTIEVDDFNKLKDGYVILDSKTNICYFKRSTIDDWFKNKKSKVFSSSLDAIKLLECNRVDYVEGVKNVWSVQMPDFVNQQSINIKPKADVVSEMDDAYHTGKFRSPQA